MFRHILSCWGAATLIVTPALFPEQVMAQDTGSGQLKSAIVYNILRFVDFPRETGSKPLIACARRGAGGNLSALSGRSVGSRTITVRTIEASSNGDGCDVVYLGVASSADVARVKQRGVLVIGDGSGFLKAGGTIGLVTTGKQTRFEVSMRAAKQADIKISSQLLRLAARVEQ
jgi:YfiR/HmsC-like